MKIEVLHRLLALVNLFIGSCVIVLTAISVYLLGAIEVNPLVAWNLPFMLIYGFFYNILIYIAVYLSNKWNIAREYQKYATFLTAFLIVLIMLRIIDLSWDLSVFLSIIFNFGEIKINIYYINITFLISIHLAIVLVIWYLLLGIYKRDMAKRIRKSISKAIDYL